MAHKQYRDGSAKLIASDPNLQPLFPIVARRPAEIYKFPEDRVVFSENKCVIRHKNVAEKIVDKIFR